MATRATIKVEGFKLGKVYKHWDGYPEATLPWLQKFNKEFTKERGDSANYKFAQLLRSSAFMATEFNLDNSPSTGWGVIEYSAECGEEFQYLLKKDGSVIVNNV